jgi:asparagine synthetase B (glutamine-hydrolysing)
LAREIDDFPAFTGWYQGDKYDERPWANLVGGLNHHEIEITPQDFIDNVDRVLAVIDGARVGPGIFGQYMVAKYASEHVDVVLSGEGGDELFGGYARLALVANREGYEMRVPDGYENYKMPADYPATVEGALRYDLRDLPSLLAVDAMATAPFGLVSRAPMTDIRVVAHVLAQEPHQRVGKVMLKAAVRGLVPDAIIDRTDKRGFPVPFVEWAQGPLRDFLGDRLGYIPDPSTPWSRKWWYDLCDGARVAA